MYYCYSIEDLIELSAVAREIQPSLKTFRSKDLVQFQKQQHPRIETSSKLVDFPCYSTKAQLSLPCYNYRCSNEYRINVLLCKSFVSLGKKSEITKLSCH